jgi:hypothetical protein
MGPGRARAAIAGACLAAALGAAGCGAESHRNDQRPEVQQRVSVTIEPDGVTVQPTKVATASVRTQQIPQNQDYEQPATRGKGPLTVVFVTANITRRDSKLEIRGPTDTESKPIYANSPGSFQTELPTGDYTIVAADIPGARAARLTVGPFRGSSQNEVLLP